jgi:hypothetical protein
MTDTIPIQRQTIDMATGKVEAADTVRFAIMPAPAGTCPDCATAHDAAQPHNAQSMRYQYAFYGREGRWPTWADAMAHCAPDVRSLWTAELGKRGVTV